MTLSERIKLFFSTKEREFVPKPIIVKDEIPPFVKRKWKQIAIAMEARDEERVNFLQNQLIESNYHAPTTLTEARELCRD